MGRQEEGVGEVKSGRWSKRRMNRTRASATPELMCRDGEESRHEKAQYTSWMRGARVKEGREHTKERRWRAAGGTCFYGR